MDNIQHADPRFMQGPLPSTYVFNQALVTQVLEEASLGKIGRCQALGFSRELIERLQELSPTELHKLFSSPYLWVRFSVDATALDRILDKIRRDEERERLINRTLRLGATGPMMAKFFGIPHNDCAERRRAMGLQVKAGRIPVLTEAQKHEIWGRWVDLVRQHEHNTCSPKKAGLHNGKTGADLEELNQLDLMLMIAEEQSIPVALVWGELASVQGAV